MVTARARKLHYRTARRSSGLRVRLYHVLLEPALLNESLRAHGTCMGHLPGVLLHVIEHRVLALLGNTAVGAGKFTRLVTQIRHLSSRYSLSLNSRHRVVTHHRPGDDPGSTFARVPAAAIPLILNITYQNTRGNKLSDAPDAHPPLHQSPHR